MMSLTRIKAAATRLYIVRTCDKNLIQLISTVLSVSGVSAQELFPSIDYRVSVRTKNHEQEHGERKRLYTAV